MSLIIENPMVDIYGEWASLSLSIANEAIKVNDLQLADHAEEAAAEFVSLANAALAAT